MSLICTVVGILIVEPMLAMMSTPPDVMGEARTYLTIYFAGISGLKSALGDAYAAVFSNEKTNDQAAEQLVKDLDQLLEDYN